MEYKLNNHGKITVDKFLGKCKNDGSYDKVYTNFDDGTWLLSGTVKNIYDVCAWLWLTYEDYVFDILNEWKKDGFAYVWKLSAENVLSFEEVENELYKMTVAN